MDGSYCAGWSGRIIGSLALLTGDKTRSIQKTYLGNYLFVLLPTCLDFAPFIHCLS